MNIPISITVYLSPIFHLTVNNASQPAGKVRAMMKMIKKVFSINLLWALSLLSFAQDANAWGLFTHLHFTQHFLLLLPLADPRILRATKKFPSLVLAGACLPDLALISRKFSATHQWQKAENMLSMADTDEEVAIAVGFASHLYVDIIAHNHFVPAHEAKWLNKSILTHIAAEWAMDAHIGKGLDTRPYSLIRQHLPLLSNIVATHFDITNQHARSALNKLAWADKALRLSLLSNMILWLLKQRDLEFVKNLNYYLHKTYHALADFESAILGAKPHLEPELNHLSILEMSEWRTVCLSDLHMHMPVPLDFYQALSHHQKIRQIS